MNRAEIRKKATQLCGQMYNANDEAMVETLNECVDSGVKRLVQELTDALKPQTIRVSTPAQIDADSATYIRTTADDWVLEFDGASSHPAPTDGTGDGIYELWVTLSDNRVVKYGCREFWSTSAPGATYYVSLVRKWAEGASTGAGWKNWSLKVPRLYLPAEVQQVVAGHVWSPEGTLIQIDSQIAEHDRGNYVNANNNSSSGKPYAVRRGSHFKLRDPNKIPTYATEEGIWGDEPYGEFDYCYTYAWGYRPLSVASEQGHYEALWESSPSPILESVVIPNGFTVVTLTLPRIDWQLGFGVSGDLRYEHSGMYLRIYRRRKTIAGGLNQDIEVGEVFQHLADIDGNAGTFTDDGSVVPDYQLRLPEIQGYYAWEINPIVTAAIDWEFLVRMSIEPLKNDYDAPRIEPQYVETLCKFVASQYAMCMQNFDLSQLLEQKALEDCTRFRQNIGWSGAIFSSANLGLDARYRPVITQRTYAI